LVTDVPGWTGAKSKKTLLRIEKTTWANQLGLSKLIWVIVELNDKTVSRIRLVLKTAASDNFVLPVVLTARFLAKMNTTTEALDSKLQPDTTEPWSRRQRSIDFGWRRIRL